VTLVPRTVNLNTPPPNWVERDAALACLTSVEKVGASALGGAGLVGSVRR